MESLQLCTQCDSNGDIEYEFPCFNMLDSQDYLWEKGDITYTNAVYGGVRIQSWPADKHLLRCVIPRLQVITRTAGSIIIYDVLLRKILEVAKTNTGKSLLSNSIFKVFHLKMEFTV